jgi:hypothetical protein
MPDQGVAEISHFAQRWMLMRGDIAMSTPLLMGAGVGASGIVLTLNITSLVNT